MLKSKNLLANTLKANALFSLVSAGFVLALSGQVTAIDELALGMPVFFAISLAAFALFVGYHAFQSPPSKKGAQTIIAMDSLYVIGSLVYILAMPEMSLEGKILVGGVAVIVADFALFQWLGLRNLYTKLTNSFS